jgi:DNA-binding CsgD family transcriptional regulator
MEYVSGNITLSPSSQFEESLQALAATNRLSNAELEAVSLALAGQSTKAISEELGISQIAVRKRLGEVYRKLDIPGTGPGKLIELRNLLPKYHNQQTNNIDKRQLYIERVPDEDRCYQEIIKPGGLVRIKAPEGFGKTSFLENLIYRVRTLDYRSLSIDFNISADRETFSNLHRFSRSFCAVISRELNLPNKLDEYWDEMLSCNYNVTTYFQKYLLVESSNPLVLALNHVDKVFEHPIAIDFCNLLRGWHDRARSGEHTSEIWQRLRLIVVHSTDVYRSLNISSSPLANVGTIIQLPEFTAAQVIDLAGRYELDWNATEVERLMELVGGHPYLVDVALKNIAGDVISLEEFLKTASTESGIYSNYLRRLLEQIKEHPELVTALNKAVTASQPVRLEPVETFKLYGMGLINLEGNSSKFRCQLYRQYFSDRLDNSDI